MPDPAPPAAPPEPRPPRLRVPTMTMLFYAHSGLRYLVLLAGVAAVLYLAYGAATGRAGERPARVVTSVYVGLLDLQILLGILLVVTGLFYPALMGHLMMMLLAAAAAHGAASVARRPQHAGRAVFIRLGGVVLSLLLIVAGVLAIGRDVFGSGAPSIVS